MGTQPKTSNILPKWYLSTRCPPCDPVPEHQVPGFLTTCRRLSGRSIFQCSNSRAPSLLFSRFHLRLSSTWQKCFHTFSFFKVEHGLFIFSYDFQLEFVVSRLGIHVFSVFLFFSRWRSTGYSRLQLCTDFG